ncbi:MAG: hypothetical protein PHN45_07415 [Methylococcales bacterium]|nr:hypothetical protein [Methylococcales bacterium]
MKVYQRICLFVALSFISVNCFAGSVAQELLELIVKHFDDIFRYIGLSGVLMFLKGVSWTKMTLGSFLAIIGTLYPGQEKENKEISGETKISWRGFSIFLKGGLRFALVVGGVILIIGSV